MTQADELRKLATELGEYAMIEGTELGQYLTNLCNLVNDELMMSPEFLEAYERELLNELDFMKTNTKIIETTEVQTITHKILDLEWIN